MNIDKQRLIDIVLEDIEFIAQQYDESNAFNALHRSQGQIDLLIRGGVISSDEASHLYDKQGKARETAERNINSN